MKSMATKGMCLLLIKMASAIDEEFFSGMSTNYILRMNMLLNF